MISCVLIQNNRMRNLRIYRFLLISLGYVFCSLPEGMAQIVSVDARLDSNEIVIGDQVGLNIEVKKNKNDIVKFPVFSDSLTHDIEIISKSPIDSVWLKDEKKVLLRQKLVVTAFDSGLYYIPPLEFLLVTQHAVDTINSRSNYLVVHPFPLDTTKTIRDIKAVEKAPVSFSELYPYILGVIFTGFLIWFLIYYVKKKKKHEPIIGKPKIEEPAHLVALRELDTLKSEKLWQRKEVKLYYSRLTEIIRKYIEKRFKIMAMEQTSDEILIEFEGQEVLSLEDFKLLREMLVLADFVKFAKAAPEPDENESHFENAYKFVNNTKYQEQVIPVTQEVEPANNEITA